MIWAIRCGGVLAGFQQPVPASTACTGRGDLTLPAAILITDKPHGRAAGPPRPDYRENSSGRNRARNPPSENGRRIQAGPPTLPHAGRPQRFSELEARIKDDTLLHLT